jgi:hypothetical protein
MPSVDNRADLDDVAEPRRVDVAELVPLCEQRDHPAPAAASATLPA